MSGRPCFCYSMEHTQACSSPKIWPSLSSQSRLFCFLQKIMKTCQNFRSCCLYTSSGISFHLEMQVNMMKRSVQLNLCIRDMASWVHLAIQKGLSMKLEGKNIGWPVFLGSAPTVTNAPRSWMYCSALRFSRFLLIKEKPFHLHLGIGFNYELPANLHKP